MENFIMLPNRLIWNYNDSQNTILNKYNDDKILYILPYLEGSTNKFGKTIFCLKDMIETSGMKLQSGKGRTNEKFKAILVKLQQDKIIKTNIDLNKIKIDTCINCKFNMPIEQINNKNSHFFNISYSNYLKILNKNSKFNKLIMLKIYFYIHARINKRKDNTDIVVHGGKSNCFYDSYTTICNDLNITENTWDKYIKELQEMYLIFYDNIGKVIKDNKIHIANNVYCTNKDELPEGLKQSKLYYIDSGYKILNKKTKQQIKIINGLKGKIQQEKNQNKNIVILNNKLNQIEEQLIDDNSNKFKIKKILENNPNKTLFYIYEDLGKPNIADKYSELEDKLEICNEDGELLVPWDYYKWIMINYNKDQHQYYLNCVRKYINEHGYKHKKRIGLKKKW